MNKTQNGVTGHKPTVNDRLAELARRFDQGEFRGPGEYLGQVTKVCSEYVLPGAPAPELCKQCGHVKDHEACNGRVE